MSVQRVKTQGKWSGLGRAVLLAATVLGATQMSMASSTVDQLSDCLVKSTTATDKTQVLQRILVEQCSAQTKAVIQADGIQAVGESFQQLGQITGEEIIKNPEVKQQLNGLLRYVDLNKMVTTFLTPEIWNKLGVVR